MTGTSPVQPGPSHHGPGRGPVPPPMSPAPAPKRPRAKAWLTHGATAFVALIVGAAIGGSGDTEDTAGRERPAPTVTTPSRAAETTRAPEPPTSETAPPSTTAPSPEPEPTAQPGPANSFEGDGQYLVGEDIAAGTYKTAGPAEGLIPNCYWARHKDASGEFSSIIANGNAQGQARVTVRKGEYLEVKGCLAWKKTG